MLTVFIYFMIFVGVTVALYQVYEVNYNINFANDLKLSSADKEYLSELTQKASAAEQTHDTSAFNQAVVRAFGPGLAPELALAAFTEEKPGTYAIPLLRRRQQLDFGEAISVRHLPFWKARLPKWNARVLMISLVIINSMLAQFLGGMSIYTLLYPFSSAAFVWLNEPVILMLLTFVLTLISHGIFRLDMYLHDLYQIGKLARQTPAGNHHLHSQNA
ncbi:hypothetical protein ACT3OH_02795 [Vreelandella zhanjiangensis]|uniref:hypothetical protein n=1 Tax=Vreelandella zhanjiangensis TaxID=1121960 RepID=UPI00402A6C13